MLLRALTLIVVVIMTATSGTRAAVGQSTTQPAAVAFDSARAWTHLKAMVDLGPRPSGSAELRQTRAYITRQIAALGLTLQEQPFTATTPNGPVEMSNLIVTLPGRRPDRVLFTGHYDTKWFKDIRFVGASDGASSAAFLIELVRVLKDQPREFTYEFVWFDGEEAVAAWNLNSDSTYGSRFYVQQATKAGNISTIKALILVDMIGNKTLRIERDSYSAGWLNGIVWGAARRLGKKQFVDVDTTIEDDHVHFVKAGIPSIDLIDLNKYIEDGHWHTASDSIENVSAASLGAVGDVLLAALPEIVAYLQK
ncbi:MAG: M28 family peptidase [Vicinamibacterales bacterium]